MRSPSLQTPRYLKFAVIFSVLLASDWALAQSLVDPQRLKVKTNERDGAAVILIKGGGFEMGSDAEELKFTWARLGWDLAELEFTKSEQPKHHVKVDNFWIYRDLVTVSQYRTFCQATGTTMPNEPSYGWRDNNPIVNVSWHDAKAYCQWAGCRLPFEAEWEYAARGKNTGLDGSKRTVFVWGDNVPDSLVANLADETFLKSGYYDNPNFHIFHSYDDGHATASPVNSFAPNDVGLRDMAGNVLEWCEDWFDPGYYSVSSTDNPRGPTTGTKRVLRGGAFDTIPTITRIARRLSNDPNIRNEEKGFRCVLSK